MNEYLDIITGSVSAGKFLENADEKVIQIVASIEMMNDTTNVPALKGMDFLSSFIKETEGVQGHLEGVREYKVWAVEDGSYQDADTENESYKVWRFGRKGYTIKDRDFDYKLIRQAREEGKDPFHLLTRSLEAITDLYLNKYLPNMAYSTLFELPNARAKSDYYGEPKGFLMETPVREDMLKPRARKPENLVRNHYRKIAGEHVELEDIQAAVAYLTEYRDINGGNIVGLANDFTKFKLINTLAYDANKDIFGRTGQPADLIAGVKFISNDFIPDDVIIFVYGSAKELITKLISPDSTMRGMAIYKESGFQKLENITDLVGSKFVIQPEGYHLTGRHYALFLDISGDGTLSTPRAIGYSGAPAERLPVMGQNELDKLIDQKVLLDEDWKISIGG